MPAIKTKKTNRDNLVCFYYIRCKLSLKTGIFHLNIIVKRGSTG